MMSENAAAPEHDFQQEQNTIMQHLEYYNCTRFSVQSTWQRSSTPEDLICVFDKVEGRVWKDMTYQDVHAKLTAKIQACQCKLAALFEAEVRAKISAESQIFDGMSEECLLHLISFNNEQDKLMRAALSKRYPRAYKKLIETNTHPRYTFTL